MLVSSLNLLGAPVLSVRAGGAITYVSDLVVDPDHLKVIAMYCRGGLVSHSDANILSVSSVREYSPLGFIIDDVEELVTREDVVKVDRVLNLGFSLIGLKVETKKGSKLGKISDFTLNPDDFIVQQIIVRRPALKALVDPELVISRKEIVKVTDDKIVVKDEEETLKKRAEKEDFVPNFVNPFRNQEKGFAPVDTIKPDQDSVSAVF